MKSGVSKLNEICDRFNEELQAQQIFWQKKIDKLEKWRIVVTKIKIGSLLVSILETLVIAYFLFMFPAENISKTIDDFVGGIFILWIITLLVIFVSKKVIEKIFQEESEIRTYLMVKEERMKEEYVEKIYYPYVAKKFQGEYDKKQLELELKESGLSLYDHVEYDGGLCGICEGIPFKENYVCIIYKQLNGDTEISFAGTIIQFPNPKPCTEPVYVQHFLNNFFIEKTVPNIKVDNTAFNDSVLVKGNDKVSAFRVLTPKYMERILPMISSMEIPTLIYGREHILVFVKDKKIDRVFEPQFPFDVQQCDSCASQLSREKSFFIKKIYTDIVESMR